MLSFRNPGMVLGEILTVAGLAVGAANGQTLIRRGGDRTPELQKIYASSEYNAAYQIAEATYNETKPQPYNPYLWNPKDPYLWLGYKQKEMGQYTLDFGNFEDRLDAASENPQVKNNPKKVAQLSQIQDRLTEENMKALNDMVTAVDLRTLFTSNDKPEIADLWVSWQLPEGKQVLDESKMVDVLKFAGNILKCFSESHNYNVRYSRSGSFSKDVPTGADNKPLTIEEALFYWKFENQQPVNTAMKSLYDSLHQAQAAAEAEGLLDLPTLNAAVTIPAHRGSKKKNSTSTAALHP